MEHYGRSVELVTFTMSSSIEDVGGSAFLLGICGGGSVFSGLGRVLSWFGTLHLLLRRLPFFALWHRLYLPFCFSFWSLPGRGFGESVRPN